MAEPAPASRQRGRSDRRSPHGRAAKECSDGRVSQRTQINMLGILREINESLPIKKKKKTLILRNENWQKWNMWIWTRTNWNERERRKRKIWPTPIKTVQTGPALDGTVGERFGDLREFRRICHDAARKDEEAKRTGEQPGGQMKSGRNA